MKKQKFVVSIVVTLLSLMLMLIGVACNIGGTSDSTQTPQLVVTGYETTITVNQDATLEDSDILAGVTALYGDVTYTVYVVDKSAVDTADLGEKKVTIGVKDAEGNIVKDSDGKDLVYQRTVRVVENYYPNVTITGIDALAFYVDSEITDEMLLNGTSAGTGFTVYVKDGSALDSSELGEYEITLGVKKGDRIVKSSENTEVTATRIINIIEPEAVLNISFYHNDEAEIAPAYVELNTSADEAAIDAIILEGISAKDDDFREYLVKIADKSDLDVTTVGEYIVTLGAYSGNDILQDADGNDFVTTRKIIVKAFEKLDAPTDLELGTGNDVGKIKFSGVDEARNYVARIMTKDAAADAQPIAEIELEGTVLSLGYISLASGDYTISVKAQGEGYQDSDYSLGFNITYTLFAEFLPEAIAEFDNVDHGEPALENGLAKITALVDGWGKARSEEFTINYAYTPILALDIAKADNSHFATLFIGGKEIVVIGDTRGGDPMMKAIPKGNYAGRQKAQLILGPTGGGPSVWYKAARIFALEEYSEPVVGFQLPDPTNIAVASTGDSISWKGHDLCEEYKVTITKRGTSEIVEEGTTDELSYRVAHLAAGNYTFKVQAIGKEPTTISSGEASWDFMIKEYANWNAEAIAQFTGVGFEAETSVGIDGETGLAVININGMRDFGAVAVAPENAPYVNLANRPVIVMKNATIAGGWLARSIFNDTIINIMKNDTYESKTYEHLILSLWQNADGGLINGATGSANSPAGSGAYRFFMGFCGGTTSSVALESMRIVYVEEYYEGNKPLVTPNAFAKSSLGSDISWTSNGTQYEYELYRYTANEAFDRGTVTGSSLKVAHLPTGNYTLKVKALGSEADQTADSAWGTYDFSIANVLDYSAEEIAQFVKIGDGTITYDPETGVVTIEATGEGDFYIAAVAKDAIPTEGTTNLFSGSSRTVVVIEGLKVVNGSWIAKMYGRGQGTGAAVVYESAMHNADENSYEYYYQSAWLDNNNLKLDIFTSWAGGPGGYIYDYYYAIGATAGSKIEIKGMKLAQITDLIKGSVTIGGEVTPIGGDVGETITDEQLLEGLKAAFGADEYTLYVADRTKLDGATVAGAYTVIIGVKDLGGNVVMVEGEALTVERVVNLVSNFYENVEFEGAEQITIEEGESLTDEDLLAGIIVSDAESTYTAYIVSKSELNNAQAGTYTVIIGAKDGEQVVMKDLENAWTITRTIVVEHKVVITFKGASDIAVGLNATLSAEQIEELVLAGVTATEALGGNYTVKIKESQTVDLSVAGTYVFVLGAYDETGELAQNKTQQFTLERKFIVRDSAQLSAPATFTFNNGTIVVGEVQDATAYTAVIVAFGEGVTATPVDTLTLNGNVIAFDKVDLESGDYTLYVKASAENFIDSDYSEAFDFTYTVVRNYTAAELAQFTNVEHAEALLDGERAKIQPTADGWGRVMGEQLSVNFNKNPILVIDFEAVSNNYFVNIMVEGESGYKYITNDINNANDLFLPMKTLQAADYTGVQLLKLVLGCSGGENSFVLINSAKIFYLGEYVAPPTIAEQLDAPENLAPATDGASISWTADSNAEKFVVTVKMKDSDKVAIAELETDKLSLQVAQLAAGNYTLYVKAKGDGINYLDSEVATYDFMITEYANWTAQQIGQTFTGEGWEATSTVKYDDATGKAIINHDGSRGYGAVGNPVEGAPVIDLSRRPVVVMADVDITTGWLARAFFGNSGIIVMQNDTSVNGTVHYDYLIMATWKNVDGNLVPGAGGTKDAPSGSGAYRFLMGFTINDTSRVSLGGMRIVTISEYVAPDQLPAANTASDFKAPNSGNGSDITWSTNTTAFAYEVYVKDTETLVTSGTGVGSSFNAAALKAGTYTLKIKALGDNVFTSDAKEWGSYSFTVKDAYSYTAEDIAAFIKLEGEGTVTYNAETGKTTISAGEGGALFLAPMALEELISASSKFIGSNRPVVVIEGLTVINGKWCARAYGRGSVNSYNTTQATMHNDDATSYEIYVQPAWINSDGNNNGIFSGSATAPGGYVRDYMYVIGVTAGSTIEIGSLRVVTVAAA